MRDRPILGVGREAVVENLDEPRVELDEVEPVAVAESPDDVPCDGARSGADLEHANRAGTLREGRRHRLREEAAARRDRAGRDEGLAELSEEGEVFGERASLVFKRTQVVRFYDTKRKALVYVSYTDRIIEGSPRNSISVVPVGR